MRVIFAGAGEFGLPTLQALIDAKHEVVQVITQPDRPAGRGRTLTETAIASLASSRQIPLLKTANINAEQLPSADVMVVIAFGQKIASHIVDHPRLGSVNLHASILPKYRGAAPINWAIIRGEDFTGNSIIRLAQKMDAGPVLAQSKQHIGPLETAGSLHDALAEDGAPLLLQTLEDLETGRAAETPQDESKATLAPKLSREMSKINWQNYGADVAFQIRGMYPWPGCRVRVLDQSGNETARVTLVCARPASGQFRPGEIGEERLVGAGRDCVEILELQPQGKRPMTIEAYRNGHPWEVGMRLESIA